MAFPTCRTATHITVTCAAHPPVILLAVSTVNTRWERRAEPTVNRDHQELRVHRLPDDYAREIAPGRRRQSAAA